tara:strand:+ start:4356 stop:5069 length:714 start_codon:yes stop_codon:yes gene_type:complete
MVLTKDNENPDFQAGSIIIVDKPLTWTSFNVVSKIRYIISRKLNIKKIKVGHAGTLDPLATGVLIICTGKATKTIESIQAAEKEYTGTFFIGATTPSYDKEMPIDNKFSIEHIDKDLMEKTRLSFLGETDQHPPIFSALKVDGKRAYKSAREGVKVKLKPRKITITDFEIDYNLPELAFKVACSKGTYIRSIAYDFGKKMNAGSYMSSLIRTRNGDYTIEDAWNLEELIEYIQNLKL